MTHPLPDLLTPPTEIRQQWADLLSLEAAVAHDYFDQRPSEHHDLSWIDHFAELVDECGWASSVSEIRAFLSQRAWRDRQRWGLLEWRDDFLRLSTNSTAEKFCIYYLGAALRFDFRLGIMATATSEWIRRSRLNHESDELDALLVAYRAFAILEKEPEEGLQLISHSMTLPNASATSRNVCLHAVWLVKSLPEQGDVMLDIVRQKRVAGDVLGVVEQFWIAKAHRLRRDIPAAFSSIDRAFDLLSSDVDYLSIHQDFVRERENILIEAQLARAMDEHLRTVTEALQHTGGDLSAQVTREVESARDNLLAATATAEKEIADSLFNVVSVLGIFVGILGFLASAGGIVAKGNHRWWADCILMAVTGLVITLMFFLLRVIVGSVFRKK